MATVPWENVKSLSARFDRSLGFQRPIFLVVSLSFIHLLLYTVDIVYILSLYISDVAYHICLGLSALKDGRLRWRELSFFHLHGTSFSYRRCLATCELNQLDIQ